jgi:hypothetical protein
MQMIDLMKRLAELDAKNSNVVKESSVDECGMMGSMGMSRPHSPASINMTAATGKELSSMLKDIMTLAGHQQMHEPMHDVEPMGGADGVAVVDVEPSPEVGADEPSIMRSMIDKLNPEVDTEIGDNDDEKTDETYDNSPDVQVAGYDAAVPSGNDLHKEKQQFPATQRGDNPMAVTFESLMAEYRKFLGEGMSDHEDELSLRTSVLDVLQTIYDGASAGEEMIDTVADELGDYYDEVEQSGDQELMKAYRFVREKGADAEGNPEMMAKVVKQAMSVLGNDQGVAEGQKSWTDGTVEYSMTDPNNPDAEIDVTIDYTIDHRHNECRVDSVTNSETGEDLTNKVDRRQFIDVCVNDYQRRSDDRYDQGMAEADTMESMLKLAGLKK